jgi:hypothetical protein
MVKVLFNLYLERFCQGSPIFKPLQRVQPPIEGFAPVDDANLGFIRADDLDEVSDDVGEKGDSQQHHDHGHYLFDPADGVIVAVPYCSQCSQGKIAGCEYLSTQIYVF